MQRLLDQAAARGDADPPPPSERLDPIGDASGGTGVALTEQQAAPPPAPIDPEIEMTDMYRESWRRAEIMLEGEEDEVRRILDFNRRKLRGILRAKRAVISAMSGLDAPLLEDQAPQPAAEPVATVTPPAAAAPKSNRRKGMPEQPATTKQPADV